MRYYDGKRLLVTGGGTGIGLAIARQAAALGASVCVVGRRREVLEQAVAEIRAVARAGRRVEAESLDVSDAAAVAAAVPEIEARLGGIDVLVNNAGIAHVGRFEDTPEAAVRGQLETNLLGSMWMTRACLGRVPPGGRIVFVSSLAGLLGLYGFSAYGASKFALTGFAEILRQELVGTGVRVCVLFPPDVRTPMLEAELPGRPPEARALAGHVAPLSADAVARVLLRGVARGRFHIIPDARSRFVVWAARHFPGLVRWVMDREIRAVRRRALPAG